MNILLLTPPPLDGKLPAERIFGCNYGIYTQPNILSLYAATMLQQAGHQVTCLDFPLSGKKIRDFRQFCSRQNFEVIIFYTVFLSKDTDLAARELLRRHNPDTRFVFSGTEPSANPAAFTDDRSVVIRGEPETVIAALMTRLANGSEFADLSNVSWSCRGHHIDNPGSAIVDDLDSLPFPDRSLLPPGNYHNPKLALQPFTTMLASRGCSFRCYYCVPNSLSFAREIEHGRQQPGKPPVRLRSAANVIAEFRQLAAAGYRSISFIDDQFVWGRQRTLEICRGIANTGVEWSCLARADMLKDLDVVTAMAQAGCRYIDIGIESFQQQILDFIGKGCRVEDAYLAVANLKTAGIEPEVNVLIGSCPLETEQTIEHTFRETLKLDVDYVLFSVCTPFPYTRFNEIAHKEGWMIADEYQAIDPIKQSFISYPHLNQKKLEKIIHRLYRRFYFRPGYLCKRLKNLRSFRDFVNKARAALTILR